MQNIVIIAIIHNCIAALEYLKSSYEKTYSQFLEIKITQTSVCCKQVYLKFILSLNGATELNSLFTTYEQVENKN